MINPGWEIEEIKEIKKQFPVYGKCTARAKRCIDNEGCPFCNILEDLRNNLTACLDGAADSYAKGTCCAQYDQGCVSEGQKSGEDAAHHCYDEAKRCMDAEVCPICSSSSNNVYCSGYLNGQTDDGKSFEKCKENESKYACCWDVSPYEFKPRHMFPNLEYSTILPPVEPTTEGPTQTTTEPEEIETTTFYDWYNNLYGGNKDSYGGAITDITDLYKNLYGGNKDPYVGFPGNTDLDNMDWRTKLTYLNYGPNGLHDVNKYRQYGLGDRSNTDEFDNSD